MKVLALLLVVVVLAQAAEIPKVRDLSKFKPKYPKFATPFSNLKAKLHKPTSTIKRTGVHDLRAVCGKPGPAERIVGGTEATPHQYPWQVALFIDDLYFCGGSLISNDYVLTAAHCAEDAGFMNVMLGAHNVREASETGRIELTATEFTVHPNWNSFTLSNDLALVKLPKSVTFNSYMAPICLAPSSDSNHAGESLTVTGWGRPSDSASSISPVLRQTNATCITTAECQDTYGSTVTDKHICISTEDGHGSCNGDSGGPLSSVAKGIFSQVGIVSFGSSLGCEVGLPDGFTRVSSYVDWIESETGLIL
jgi:secreted trypsin-like serine protease